MKQKRRFISFLLALCLLVGILPNGVMAAHNGKAIQLVNSGAESIANGDIVWYGDYGSYVNNNSDANNTSIRWLVLDADKTNTGDSGMFLLAENLIGTGSYGNIYFQYSRDIVGSALSSDSVYYRPGTEQSVYANTYQGSDAQEWCETFYSTNLSEGEQAAVLATYKQDEAYKASSKWNFSASELSGDKVFFLSAEEADNSDYGFTNNASRLASYKGEAGYWWLRSPFFANTGHDGNYAGNVWYNGAIYDSSLNSPSAARPAFNLNLDSVLFTSAAKDGKVSDTVGADALKSVSDYSGNEWKLTLLDKSRSFLADVNEQISVSASAGGSIQIAYSGAQTGDNEYVSVLLCDSNATVLYYGNIAQNSESGTATLNIPLGLAAGSYTLKVFSEQCNGDYKTDYASAFKEIALEVVLPQETTPSAAFTATSDNGGTLLNVDTSMKYSVDGGITWMDITGQTMAITGVTAENGIKVYKQGDGTTTSDSQVQTIAVTQAEQPTGIDKVDCTISQQNNGQITGVDTTMEYKLSTDSDWTLVTDNAVTGLTNGTYEVRVKADGTVLASNAATVTIGAHTCVAQGDWQYDGTSHWKLCTCGAKVEEAAHTGGTATCTASAVCEVCSQPYGEKNPNNHTCVEAWITTDATHTKVYSCCQTVIEAETEHTWENGKCSICQYDCEHQGGTATCSQLAQCEICHSLYGNYDENNHRAADTWMQENGKHYHICEYGCDTHLDEADCSGGTATCIGLAICETCRQTYGVVNPDNHTGKAVWTKTETIHSSAYDCCGAVVIAEEVHEWEDGVCSECGYECQHSGGKATCTEQAVCEICNEKYGDMGTHKLSLTKKVEATCTTDGREAYYTCEACGKYFEDEAGNTEIANLDEWGIIPASNHKAGAEWKSDENNHWKECELCGEKMNEAAHDFEWVTDKKATATEAGLRHEKCTVCGYTKAAVEIPATGTTSDTDTPTDNDQTDNTTSPKTDDNRTGSTTSPKTGDNTNIALWIVVVLSACAALTGTAIYSRKRKYNR